MEWTGWTITGAAIALAVLAGAGIAYAVVRAVLLKRRVGASTRRISPVLAGIEGSAAEIEQGLARAEQGASDLAREVERLRVAVAELHAISRHAAFAIAQIRGPLRWVAGVRALVRYRRR